MNSTIRNPLAAALLAGTAAIALAMPTVAAPVAESAGKDFRPGLLRTAQATQSYRICMTNCRTYCVMASGYLPGSVSRSTAAQQKFVRCMNACHARCALPVKHR